MPTTVSVGDIIASDEPGFACSKSKLVPDGLVHLRPFNIATGGGLTLNETYRVPFSVAPRGRTRLEAGDILFNNTNSADLVGKSALIREPLTAGFSNHLTRLRVDRAHVEPEWFALWLRHEQGTGHFTRNATRWVSQAAYKSSELKKRKLVLPTLSEQCRAIDLLSRAENIVRMRREAGQKAMEIIPALFLDMFGDPARNPKGWERSTLGDVIYAAQDRPHVSPRYADDGIPFLSTRHIKPGVIQFEDLKYLNLEDAEQQWKKCRPQRGDVLYTKGGTTGLAAAIEFDDPVAVWVHVALLKTNHTIVDPVWLESMLNSEYCYAQSQEFTHGIANRDLGLSRMVKIKMYQPPRPLQARFAGFVHELKELRAAQAQAIQLAQASFDSLLAGVFGDRA